jgi:hypothetical protein
MSAAPDALAKALAVIAAFLSAGGRVEKGRR